MSSVVGALRVNLGLDSAQFDAGVSRAQRSTGQLQQSFAGLNRSAQGGAGGLTNLSYQVQDFAVQVAAGTSASQALAQQLPQLLSGFGLLGALAGTAAAVMIPLTSHFLGLGRSAIAAKDQLEGLNTAVDNYVAAARAAMATPLELMEDYGVSIGQARELLRLETQLVRLREETELRSSAGSIAGDLGRFSGAGAAGVLAERARMLEEIADLELRAADATAQDAEALGQRNRELRAALVGTQDLATAVGELSRELGFNAASEAEDLAVALAAVDDATDPRAQAAAWREVREELLRAAGGTEELNEEGRVLLQQTIDAEAAALRMGAAMARMGELDIAAPFQEAFEAVDRLVDRLDEGLGSLRSWSGAIGDFVGSFSPGALGGQLEGMTDGLAAAQALIKNFEGYQPVGSWDVNAYRAGYGSDTVTLSDGSIVAITQGMAVNRADAERDLERRTREFAAIAMREVGADRWAQILPAQQAVLASLAYNYGNLPNAVAEAVRSGSDMDVGRAIVGLGSDNEGINRNRRNQEAAIYAAGVGAVADAQFREAESARAAEEATRDADRARQEAERAAREQASLTERAAEAFNSLLASIDPNIASAQQLAEAQETVAENIRLGNISATEGAAAIEAFTRYQLENSEAAKEMAAAQEAAAEEVRAVWEGTSDSIVDWMVDGFKGGMDSLKDILVDGLKQLAAIAIRNRIMVPLQMGFQAGMGGGALPGMGGGGLLGGIGSAIGGAMGGFGAGLSGVVGGFMSGGFGGAGAAISTALSGATSGLAGFATAVGALALPIAAVVGVFSLFRKKTEVLDAGLRVTVDGMDALVQTFEKTKTTRLFGLLKNTDTDVDTADTDVAAPIRNAYREVYRSVTDMAKGLGIGARAFSDFSYEFQLSLKDMTEEQQQRALAAEFEKIADALATTAGITGRFIRLGESAGEALERMSTNLSAANGAMAALGFGLYDVSLEGANAASRFVELFGSLDQFSQATEFYFQNFYSLAERTREAARQFGAGLSDLGVKTVPQTIEQFRALVDRLMDGGHKIAAAGLIGLAPLFQELLGLREEGKPDPVDPVEPAKIVSRAELLEDARRAAQDVDVDRFGNRFAYESRQAAEAQRVLNPTRPRTALSEEDRALLRQVRDAAQTQTQVQTQIAVSTHRTARALDKFDVDGLPGTRT